MKPDNVIEHDPERGCGGCPFAVDEMGPYCQAADRDLVHEHIYGDEVHERLCTDPVAPSWCPLRSGPVVVRAGEGRAQRTARDLAATRVTALDDTLSWADVTDQTRDVLLALRAELAEEAGDK